eukprot:scaffold108_cov162-Amphora_coffeaeformis.AAC.16
MKAGCSKCTFWRADPRDNQLESGVDYPQHGAVLREKRKLIPTRESPGSVEIFFRGLERSPLPTMIVDLGRRWQNILRLLSRSHAGTGTILVYSQYILAAKLGLAMNSPIILSVARLDLNSPPHPKNEYN